MVTPIEPPANEWMTTPDDLAWRSRILVEELAVPLLALGGCDGADAHPAAITSADTPSIARQKLHTMRRSG